MCDCFDGLGKMVTVFNFCFLVEEVSHAIRDTYFVANESLHIVPPLTVCVVNHSFFSRAKDILITLEVFAIVEGIHHDTWCKQDCFADMSTKKFLFKVC